MSEPFDMIQRHVKTADVILDIGCANIDPNDCVGDQNEFQELHRMFPRAIFCLFEPDPRWYESIVRNIQVVQFYVHFYPWAISDHKGTINFHQSIDWKWSSSIRQPKDHLKIVPHIRFSDPIQVECVNLDWFVLPKIIDLIWADIQGAEVDMINGGKETLARTRYLYTEYDNVEMYAGQINLAGILERLPYFELVDSWHNNVLLRNTKL